MYTGHVYECQALTQVTLSSARRDAPLGQGSNYFLFLADKSK